MKWDFYSSPRIQSDCGPDVPNSGRRMEEQCECQYILSITGLTHCYLTDNQGISLALNRFQMKGPGSRKTRSKLPS
jgi:hypothetical protein